MYIWGFHFQVHRGDNHPPRKGLVGLGRGLSLNISKTRFLLLRMKHEIWYQTAQNTVVIIFFFF